MKRWLLLFALFAAGAAHATELLMVRSHQAFPEAMLALQSSISAHGYTVSRVQRVDVGLTSSGFKTDKYRIVFFGKPDEVHQLTAKYPQLIPYLPLQMTIFAEGDDTLVVTYDPTLLAELMKDSDDRHIFMRWKNDFLSILDDVRGE